MEATRGDVTVIVPVWNRRDLLERLLVGLRAQTHAASEVLVVDDGSHDAPVETAQRMGAKTIRMDTHGGFAKAVNRGIRESRTALVAIVNNDVELAPDWLEKLLAGLTAEVWFATGKILNAAEPDRIDGTYDAMCRGGTSWRVGHGRADGSVFHYSRQICSAPMTAALFRTALFEKVGPLDERFESYLEDVDFGIRCAMAGYAGRYVHDAVAWHQGSATLGRWHPETVRRISRNQVFLVAKYYSARMLARHAWPILVAQGLWGLVALKQGAGWPWLLGKAEALRRWKGLRDSSLTLSDKRAANFIPLIEGEREIRRVQRSTGQDLYWSLYFLLTPGGAK